MAGKLSIPYANKVLNALLRGEPYTLQNQYWLALFTAGSDTPLRTDSLGTAGEVADTGTGYARVPIGGAGPLLFTQSTAAMSKASDVVLWPTAEASWGIVTYVAAMTAANGGNIVVYGALQAPKTVDAGDTFRVPLDSLVLAM